MGVRNSQSLGPFPLLASRSPILPWFWRSLLKRLGSHQKPPPGKKSRRITLHVCAFFTAALSKSFTIRKWLAVWCPRSREAFLASRLSLAIPSPLNRRWACSSPVPVSPRGPNPGLQGHRLVTGMMGEQDDSQERERLSWVCARRPFYHLMLSIHGEQKCVSTVGTHGSAVMNPNSIREDTASIPGLP